MNRLEGNWWSEPCEEHGSAFSLKVKSRLHEEQTAFQKIEVYETEKFGNLMVIDGFVMLTSRDNFLYHEMMSHPALYTHPAPKRVLIIGGGDCGTLREVLRHSEVERALQVDIDEGVTRAAEKYFPELCESNDDPRAELHFADGIRWVKEAAPGSYDVIIVDSTDPIGPAEGLFGEPFYGDCHAALGEHGLLVQQSESPLYHMRLLGEIHRYMRKAGFADSHTLHFPQPVYPSGWWSATLARKDGPIEGFREADAANRPFATRYYSPEVHQGALALPPFMKEAFANLQT
ncbi:polyamine aminopropyltransferase [Thiohalomonas denitrificans]|uniref:Polyamine aminopropyltransferase n=1 Tax=Thiohalomonas denitrificans TaxID=415747 RepID=A0A1G5QZ26_9GAMM|nr:polyamine aminopropyltransferase [Thiohalomonas denitrificans]SCZ67032.1 spermidine synthase [Thiohalomonas denitrificans]